MNCKSCNSTLKTTDKFCSNCGGKIVHDRLSLRGTWTEFVGPFFNWENNFWRTFFGLFKNPKDVLEAYISGARKKYFQPFSYLLLYATVAVIFYKLFPYTDFGQFKEGFNAGTQLGGDDSKKLPFDILPFMEGMYNYYNFIIILSIPIYSLLTYITFIKKGNNYAEHLIFNSYLQANIGFVSIVMQILFLNLLNLPTFFSLFQILFSISFSIYLFVKLYQLNLKQTIVATIIYWLLLFVLFFITIVPITIFVVLKVKGVL